MTSAMIFALLFAGALLSSAAFVVAVIRHFQREAAARYTAQLEALESVQRVEIEQWREKYRRVLQRCRQLENELTEIKLRAAVGG